MASFKARITLGCTASSFVVNGKDWNAQELEDWANDGVDRSFQEKDAFKKALLKRVEKEIESGELDVSDVLELLESDRDHYDAEPCDQCFDTVYWKEWDI